MFYLQVIKKIILLKELERLHHQDLRLTLGPFHTSVKILYAEAKKSPLSLKQHKLAFSIYKSLPLKSS